MSEQTRGPRNRRPRSARGAGSGPSGELLELEIGAPAHGGTCVARHEGQVFFVAGTLPGERVLARVSELKARFGRADTVEVLSASPDRVAHIWPEAEAAGIGGAELGHVALAAQREWKRAVVAEQLQRLAGETWAGEVEAAPGDEERGGLGWRTRLELVADDEGRLAMRSRRSHRLTALETMPLAHEAIQAADPFAGRYVPSHRYRLLLAGQGSAGPDMTGEPEAADGDAPVVGIVDLGPDRTARGARRSRSQPHPPLHLPPGLRSLTAGHQIETNVAVAGGRLDYVLAAGGFWQVHREAPAVLVDSVLEAAQIAPGMNVWDLYAGAGLFALPLARAVGEDGFVWALEGDRRASDWAQRNLAHLPQAHVDHADVQDLARLDPAAPSGTGTASREGPRPDVVVLDPPRTGAGIDVASAIAGHSPSRIVYVACDPASLARDIGALKDAHYRLASLRAFDLFPHTHHVECVAVVER